MQPELFNKKRANIKKLFDFGFKKSGKEYKYQTDIMNGEFKLIVSVSIDNGVQTRLVESETGDLYTLHLYKEAKGLFVGQVKEEYNRILEKISKKCFEKDIFQNEDSKKVIEYISSKYGDEMEYLWENFPNNAVCRRKDNAKWYCVILTVKCSKLGLDGDNIEEVLDIRASVEDVPELLTHKNIFTAYHMNKKSWITVILNGSMPIKEIFERIDKSYELAKK